MLDDLARWEGILLSMSPRGEQNLKRREVEIHDEKRRRAKLLSRHPETFFGKKSLLKASGSGYEAFFFTMK